jgi:hypothetical protein
MTNTPPSAGNTMPDAGEWAEELAEELVSAANIVTIGGCYEVDIDRVSLELSRRCVPVEEYQRIKVALVTAMIPIEAILLSGTDAAFCQDVRDALRDAQNTARAALKETTNADR